MDSRAASLDGGSVDSDLDGNADGKQLKKVTSWKSICWQGWQSLTRFAARVPVRVIPASDEWALLRLFKSNKQVTCEGGPAMLKRLAITCRRLRAVPVATSVPH